MRGPLARVAGAWIALACASLPAFELPEERTVGRPLVQAPHPRSGEITWRPGLIEATPKGVRIDLTVMNGTSRYYKNLMLRLVLRGPGHQLATVRYPTGRIRAGSSRVIHAYLASPGFEVEETQLELVWSQE